MYNPRIIAYSTSEKTLNTEKSITCPDKPGIGIMRSLHIVVEYENNDGITFVSYLQGRDSALLQSLITNLSGRSICDASDLGFDTLKEIVILK